MYKKSLLAILLFTVIAAKSQTLFTYNAIPVSKEEFLKAFNKNPDTTGSHAQKLKEYLNMYINFKLKLQEAYDEKLETKDEYKDEADNFKKQLTENYINEQANINQLVHEAFVRGQKDILLAEVFVAVPPDGDTLNARKQIQEALNALNAGKNFEEVTVAFSTDETIKQQNGSMGYITVFSLPYEVENMVYGLKPGAYSGIYHSSIGYHIFKNVSERPAAGKRKIQQVLFPFGATFSDEEKTAVKRKADSVYKLIQNGALFDDVARNFASTNQQTNGITTVGTGMYSSDFEKQVYALQKPGDISAPFATAYGYHIIKLLEVVPIPVKEDDVVSFADMQQKVQGDDRLSIAKNNLIQKWMVLTKYKKGVYNEDDLWKYTDTALAGKNEKAFKNINGGTIVFSFAKQNITVADWIKYVKSVRQLGGVQKQYYALLQDLIKESCNDYYRSHIEDYNTSISDQVKEFNEANMLFAVMDKHVWSKASQDSTALLQYYLTHKDKYIWAPGLSALVVTASNKTIIDSIALNVKAAPANWRNITGAYTNMVSADSNRYENGQLPVKQAVPMQQGFASMPEKNETGDSYTFVYVFNTYPQPAPRSFDDAKGMAINDYQQVLEDEWVAGLKKKYPVKVNEEVFKSIP